MSLKTLLFAATSVIFATIANGEVHKLTVDNFDSFLKENPLSLVKFYAPWCGHCKTLAPHYEAASEKLPEGIKLAEVDVTEQEAIGTRFEIKGFPTMKFFRGGEAEEYTGGRTEETIVEWINLMTSDPVTAFESLEKARGEFPEETLIVGTFADDSEESKTFMKLAESNRTLGRFISMKGETSLKIYTKGSVEGTAIEMGEDSEMVASIKSERLPLFGPVSGENFSDYMETGLDFIWFAGVSADMELVKETMSAIGKEQRGKFNVVWLDTEAFARQAEGMLGVTEYPAVVRTLDGPGRYVLDSEITQENIQTWLKNIESGELKASLKSEPVPETNDEGVKVVVGTEFEKMVADDKDVLLKIYAPWCGHCKKIAPVFDEVAEKVAKLNPNVVLAKLDGTGNEIPVEGYEFQGFPTIYYKKAGEKAVVYSGGREVDDLMAYLAENATDKFEYTAEAKEESHDDEL